ncbi:dihydropteroate synthase [Saccharospirillum impatiens]|uniref:dihydropteroate synthase n=1 Tax=Saccharospirillum impatiens TaxID=169438 RepID=UPI00040E2343|nr:dihydropteroate synthase [Saccharospirillum impatiens]
MAGTQTHPSDWMFGDRSLDLGTTRVMGVVNVTPDSFSDGGRFISADAALAQARRLMAAGASILDVGGESTRPGATPVSVQQELDRVVPVIESLAQETDVILSVDTSTPEVMREAAHAGAHLINDVRALSRDGALRAAMDTGLAVCLMHMQGQPGTMQMSPEYDDVVAEVERYLNERILACEAAGLKRQQLLVDPGFGFGKTLGHNLSLLKHLQRFTQWGCPVLVGMSRKSMIGDVLDKPVDQRLYGSLAAAVAAAMNGASIVRVHDVAETSDAIAVINALNGAS